VSQELDALTAKLLAKDPNDRYTSAAELAEDLRRVRDGLRPLAIGLGEQRTARMPQDTARTRPVTTVFGPGRRSVSPPSRGRQWTLVVPLVALILGMALLSILTWALGGSASKQDAPEAGGAARVEVPDVVGLSQDEAQERLEGANLELGSQDEAFSDEAAVGLVIKQNPAAGTEAERGSAVDVTVGTGPDQGPAKPSSQTASPSAPASSSPSASPASAEGEGEAAKEAQEKAAEEAAKQREKAREEAQKRAEERQNALEESRKEAKE
jgi:eukaryotic-like serine/threonine-protein kinase